MSAAPLLTYRPINEATNAIATIINERFRSRSKFLTEKSRHMLTIEQYVLTACLEYHRTQKHSPYEGIEIRHVFATLEEALSPHGPRRAGFTHLAAGAKRNRRVSRDLENRVRKELPEFYEHCTNLLQAAL